MVRNKTRPLHKLNGDFLSLLRRPLCSELGNERNGTNRAETEQTSIKLRLWYKDRETYLRKLDRGENAHYANFLALQQASKQLQTKETYVQKTRARGDESTRKITSQTVNQTVKVAGKTFELSKAKHPPCYTTCFHSSLDGCSNLSETMPLSVLNRLSDKRKLRLRKKQLDREAPVVYRKLNDGAIVPALLSYHRRHFEIPFDRMAIIKIKMMEALQEARIQEDEKVQFYVEKLTQQIHGDTERHPLILHPKSSMLTEEETDKIKVINLRGRTTDTRISALTKFLITNQLPDGMDPNSYEAMQYCKYVRPYLPGNAKSN